AKWAILPSVAWLAFSLFIGGVQAFIFTSLSLAYLANAVKDSEE
ncbi:MAG TPA: F0F1 ATP synthase subunit A, partial [Anaerovibrio sp.]|nr:F0F1 ATP synthase subunit A [Anaerovibrio sp.]